jgi:hypothetical protein
MGRAAAAARQWGAETTGGARPPRQTRPRASRAAPLPGAAAAARGAHEAKAARQPGGNAAARGGQSARRVVGSEAAQVAVYVEAGLVVAGVLRGAVREGVLAETEGLEQVGRRHGCAAAALWPRLGAGRPPAWRPGRRLARAPPRGRAPRAERSTWAVQEAGAGEPLSRARSTRAARQRGAARRATARRLAPSGEANRDALADCERPVRTALSASTLGSLQATQIECNRLEW